MAAIIGDTGLVVSWAGTGNSQLIETSNAPSEFVLTLDTPGLDTTAFASSQVYAMSALANILSWSATIKGRLNPAKLGNTGIATFSGGYVTNIKRWKLDASWNPQDSTAMDTSAVTTRSFIPGLLKWSGDYTCNTDSSTAIVAPGAAAAALVLKIAEDGANDVQFSGTAFATQAGVNVRIGSISETNYTFDGTGNLTSQAGSSVYSTFLFANGTVTTPATGSLVLRAATGRTYTGSAFLSALSVSVSVDAVVEFDMTVQGSGALTIA